MNARKLAFVILSPHCFRMLRIPPLQGLERAEKTHCRLDQLDAKDLICDWGMR